ncbi:hypothetical protein Tco_0148961 [Tanacetum coccineum]
MMIATTTFIQGEAAAAGKKKGHASWRVQDQSKRYALERRSDFQGQPREGWGSSRFTPLIRIPKEILVAEAGKFKPPPPMVTSVEKRSSNKFCDFHNDKGHSTNECMQMTRQKVTQSIERVSKITFPSEEEIGGHMIHHMYVDGGSSTEVLYEHCFNRLRPEIKSQMVPATTSLIGFSGETIWPLGQLRLLVTIGDAVHSIKTWMNFMIVRSLSPYNGIIRRPGIREIQAEIPKEAGVRHENFKVALHWNFPDQEVAIRGTLSAKGWTELCSLLKENLDIFAWQPLDMT